MDSDDAIANRGLCQIAKEDVLRDLYWRVIDLQSELP